MFGEIWLLEQFHLSRHFIQYISFTFTMIRVQYLRFVRNFLHLGCLWLFGLAGRLQFIDCFDGKSRQTFSFGLEAFYGNEIICFYNQWFTETVMTAEDYFETWIVFIRQ